MEDLKKIQAEMEQMRKRLSTYEANYENKVKNKNSDAASSAVSITGNTMEKQGEDLKHMQNNFNKIEQMVDSAIKRISAVEKRVDDLEQYGRSNCLIIHGCENVPDSKPGKTPETEKYVCNIINSNLKLESPLQVQDLDIAHPLPSKKGTPIIIKFLRKTQRNEVYRKKRLLKGTKMIITESLTKRRLQLLEKARTAFNNCPVWSWKGEVYVFHNNKKKLIDDFSDIPLIKSNLSYAQKVKQ